MNDIFTENPYSSIWVFLAKSFITNSGKEEIEE